MPLNSGGGETSTDQTLDDTDQEAVSEPGGQERELRRNADSDPMREQTEQTEQSASSEPFSSSGGPTRGRQQTTSTTDSSTTTSTSSSSQQQSTRDSGNLTASRGGSASSQARGGMSSPPETREEDGQTGVQSTATGGAAATNAMAGPNSSLTRDRGTRVGSNAQAVSTNETAGPNGSFTRDRGTRVGSDGNGTGREFEESQANPAPEEELGFFEGIAKWSNETVDDAYSDTGFVSQYVDDDQIVANRPFRQEFAGATAKGLARFYTGGSAAETGALAVDAGQRASFIVTGDDGRVTGEDFFGATGYDRGDFAQQYVDEDIGTPESEERKGRAEETTELIGAAAAASVDYYKENPAQIGGIVGESVGGIGLGITAGSLATRTISPTARTPGRGTLDVSNSRFLADERATAQVPRLLDRDGPQRIDADDLDVNLDDVSSQPPDVDPEAQAQELRDIRRRRQEIISDQSSRQGGSGGGDYVAPDRGGDYVAPTQDFRTASGRPDTSRSGPTRTQMDAFSGGRGGSAADNPLSLGPGEGIKVRNLDTPTQDLRQAAGLDPEPMRAPSATMAEAGVGGSLVAGGAGAAGAGASAGILNDITVGEGTSGTTQVAPFASPTAPSRGAPADQTRLGDGFGLLGGASATQGGLDQIQGPEVSTETLQGPGEGSDLLREAGTGLSNDVDTQPDTIVDTGTGNDAITTQSGAQDSGTDIFQDTRVIPVQDTPAQTDSPVVGSPTSPIGARPDGPPIFAPRPRGPGLTPRGDRPLRTPFGPNGDPAYRPRDFDGGNGGSNGRDRRRRRRRGFANRDEQSLINPFTGE